MVYLKSEDRFLRDRRLLQEGEEGRGTGRKTPSTNGRVLDVGIVWRQRKTGAVTTSFVVPSPENWPDVKGLGSVIMLIVNIVMLIKAYSFRLLATSFVSERIWTMLTYISRFGVLSLISRNSISTKLSALYLTLLQDCYLTDLINNNSISNYKSNLPKWCV